MVNPHGKKIALIGAMGSGKTTYARQYAEFFGVGYLDTDDEITRRYGSISDIFEREGENTFREYERRAVCDAVMSDASIIACGGGVVLDKESMAQVRLHCDIVWLTAPVKVLKARIDASDRPLKNELERLVKVREPLYKRYADYIYDSSNEFDISSFKAMLDKPRKNRYDIVLCDADDTLLDFKTAMRSSILSAAHSVGIPATDEAVIAEFADITKHIWVRLERGEITRDELDVERFRILKSRVGGEFEPAEMSELFMSAMKKTRYLIDGAIGFLRKLKKRGIKVYIVTNGFLQVASERLKALEGEIDGYFISDEIGYNKPDARYFEHVLKRIGSPNIDRLIVVGDSNTSDIAGGKNAGIDTCLFDPSGKLETAADYKIQAYDDFFDLL